MSEAAETTSALENLMRVLSDGLTEAEQRELEQLQEQATVSHDGATSTTLSEPRPVQSRISAKHLERVTFGAAEAVKQYEEDAASLLVDTDHFQPITPTTFGLSGELSGVMMNEEEIMPHLRGNLRFPCLGVWSNYGIEKIPDFDAVIAKYGISLASSEKSKRIRAKKMERTGGHARKVQGSGACFCSSILFWIYSESFKIVYKFLLFRTGKFNLPGTKPEMLRDIIDICNNALIPTLRRVFQTRAVSTGQLITQESEINLVMLASVMKNYKWRRIIPPGCTLHLKKIAEILNSGKIERPYDVKYALFEYGESKLPVKFVTPIHDREDKMIRVNIFLSGKINILGAHNSQVTKKICQYLSAILTDDLIVQPSQAESVDVERIEPGYDPDDDLPFTDEMI